MHADITPVLLSLGCHGSTLFFGGCATTKQAVLCAGAHFHQRPALPCAMRAGASTSSPDERGWGRHMQVLKVSRIKVSSLAIGAAAIVFAGSWQPSALANHAKTKTRGFSGFATFYTESCRVAAGGRYNPRGLTAAHRTLPFGTRVRLTDPRSGRSVVVTINDRGPFHRGRVIDVSLATARALGMVNRGVIYVRADVQ
jgi:rare lipoprotein A (peptidoglycan hydrolase)